MNESLKGRGLLPDGVGPWKTTLSPSAGLTALYTQKGQRRGGQGGRGGRGQPQEARELQTTGCLRQGLRNQEVSVLRVCFRDGPPTGENVHAWNSFLENSHLALELRAGAE